jgi:hypothetical protein
MKEKWGKDEYREKMVSIIYVTKDKHSTASKELWKDSEYRIKVTGSIKGLYDDPVYREQMDQIYSSPEYKQKLSDNWKKPEYREKVMAIWSDPIYMELFLKGCSIRTKEMWTRPTYREKMIEVIKKSWDDDGRRDIARQRMSVASKVRWQNEEYRAKMLLMMASVRASMPRISSLQIRLYELLELLDVKFFREGVETAIGPYVFDCLVPKQGGMTKDLLIECHGEYFHNKEIVKSRDRLFF